jgi:hypothetical protein
MTDDDKKFIDEMTLRLRREEPQSGHLIAAISYKRAFVKRFGIQRGFMLCREQLRVPNLDVLGPKSVVSLRGVAEGTDLFTELWPGGRPFVHLSPPVVGEGDHTEQRGISRSGYLTCLRDVAVRGRSAIVVSEHEAIVDFENDELTSFEDNAELDPGVLYADGRTYWTMEPDEYSNLIDEALMLSGSHTNDFGHWLTEYLPKLAIAIMADVPQIPILVDHLIPRSHIQSLNLLCPWAKIIVIPHLSSCRVRKLWCASNPVYRGYYPSDWTSAWAGMLPDPENFAVTLRKIKSLAQHAIHEPTGWQRVFLARRPERKKKLVNHAEIESTAAARGFKIVYPEDLSFADQMRLVHHARYIVAPDGSNGLLAYFASQGAQACFLNSPHTLPLVELNGLLGAVGVGFTIVTGPISGAEQEEPFWNDYKIDQGVFSAFLDDWLAAGSASA